MTLEDVSPRLVLVVGLLALVPIAWFGLSGFLNAGALAAVNVVIIVVALAVAMGPIRDSSATDDGDGSPT